MILMSADFILPRCSLAQPRLRRKLADCVCLRSCGRSYSKMSSAFLPKTEDADEDPVTLMLQKTGCIDLHYKVQECIAETQDWRKCKEVVQAFKECMQVYTEQQRKKYEN